MKPRAPVKSAGVVVGRVAAINFDDKQYLATVTLNLETRYQFPKDTSAKILTSGLLGWHPKIEEDDEPGKDEAGEKPETTG